MNNKFQIMLILIIIFLAACKSSAGVVMTEKVKPKVQSTITASNYKDVSIKTTIFESEKYQYAVHFPKLESNVWNEKMQQWIDQTIDKFVEEVEALHHDNESWPYELHIDFNIFDVTETFISIKMNKSIFLGGAHPEESIHTYNFDRENEKFVYISDLFEKDSHYLEKLANFAYEKLPKVEDIEWDEQSLTGIEPTLHNYSQFVFNNEKLVIFFDYYQIGPRTLGIVELEVSNDQLNHILKEKYRSLRTEDAEKLDININTNDSTTEQQFLDPNKKHVALTFDDGPDESVTPQILDTLAKFDAHATFFVIGNRVEFHPEILGRIVNEGHEVGNHTWSHPQLTHLQPEEIKAQLAQTDEQVRNIINENTTLLRPPYGAVDDRLIELMDDHFIINWSVDTYDWQTRNREAIVQEVKNQVYDGSIILMHDIYTETAAALEPTLQWLHDEGYQVVTVSQLLDLQEMKVEEVMEVYYSK